MQHEQSDQQKCTVTIVNFHCKCFQMSARAYHYHRDDTYIYNPGPGEASFKHK